MFLWPSITFQPLQLIKAMLGAKVWRKPQILPSAEQITWKQPGVSIPLPVIQSTAEANKLGPERLAKAARSGADRIGSSKLVKAFLSLAGAELFSNDWGLEFGSQLMHWL
jgi:hypothetical protein